MLIKHQKAREKRVRAAVVRAARHGRRYIISFTLPIAFRTLEKSLRVIDHGNGNVELRADAPHAAAVETGSRPHWPPLAPLIAWVKLRGAQGISKRGGGSKGRAARGTTTRMQSKSIASALHAMESGGALDADAPEQVARAIQLAIARHGTKPHWYMRSAEPEIRANLDVQIRLALEDPVAGTGSAAAQ